MLYEGRLNRKTASPGGLNVAREIDAAFEKSEERLSSLLSGARSGAKIFKSIGNAYFFEIRQEKMAEGAEP